MSYAAISPWGGKELFLLVYVELRGVDDLLTDGTVPLLVSGGLGVMSHLLDFPWSERQVSSSSLHGPHPMPCPGQALQDRHYTL